MSDDISKTKPDDDGEPRSPKEWLHEVARVLGILCLIGITIVGLLISLLAHQASGLHISHAQLQSANSASSTAGSGVTPGAVAPGVAPTDITPSAGATAPTQDVCTTKDPKDMTLGEALLCFGKAVAAGVVQVAIVQIIWNLVEYIFWFCLVIPIILLVAAWLLWEAGDWLESHSRNCQRRRRWWQRFWCWVKRVLMWVVRVLAILALIGILISLFYCIISIIGLILIL